jgi:hypothetical protein
MQSHDFGVWAAGALGVALAEYMTVSTGDDAAYSGVGGGEQQALGAQCQGLCKKNGGVRHEELANGLAI